MARALNQLPGARERIAAVAACGQMHGTVLIDEAGRLTRASAPLRTGNPPTPAWPAFKLQWIRDNDPEAYRRTSAVLMPKDYVNFQLTGAVVMDRTEAACSFLTDPGTSGWSDEICTRPQQPRPASAPVRRSSSAVTSPWR